MKKTFYLKLVIFLLIVLNAVTFKELYTEDEAEMCYLEDNSNYVLIEKNYLSNSIVSYLYKNNNDDYLSKIYEDNKETEITDLIKREYIDEFYQKINDLLALKYPRFITEALILDDVKRSYVLRDNEMVIYFNNYEINPNVDELLYLKVNYNEIKDYLDFTVILDQTYENESGYNYTNAKKSIAFTFDDSPNKNKTNKIVEYLEDNLAHATFFVMGTKMKSQKDLIMLLQTSGNEIGSHTYNHKNMSLMTDDEVVNDFNLMNDLYKGITGKTFSLVRPPYGVIKQSQKKLIDASFILWSLDTNDWRYRNTNYIVNYVVDNVKDGDIILFHDSYNETVAAIKELLPILYSKGYQIMSVSELFQVKGLSIDKNASYRMAR